jgi:hypothetical protein
VLNILRLLTIEVLEPELGQKVIIVLEGGRWMEPSHDICPAAYVLMSGFEP